MKRPAWWVAGLFAFIALLLNSQFVLAHESITVGEYTVEIGWLNEPPVAGQNNAIAVRVSTTSDGQPVEDVSSLTVAISYGDQNKTLNLEPLDEHSPGQFIAPLIPTIPGQYTVYFGGSIGETTFVDVFAEPEEVQPADTLEFPHVNTTQPEATSFGLTEWLAIAGLVSGLAGLILSLLNMRNLPR